MHCEFLPAMALNNGRTWHSFVLHTLRVVLLHGQHIGYEAQCTAFVSGGQTPSAPIYLQLLIQGQQPGSDCGSLSIQEVALRQDAHETRAVVGQQPVVKDDREARGKVRQLSVKEPIRRACERDDLRSSSAAVVVVRCKQAEHFWRAGLWKAMRA